MSYVKPHEIQDIRYKNLLANTDPAFYTKWYPEKKGKLKCKHAGAEISLGSKLIQFWTGVWLRRLPKQSLTEGMGFDIMEPTKKPD